MNNSVLIVEEKIALQKKLSNILSNKGFYVKPARCFEDSVNYLKSNIPDIIISGFDLTEDDGLGLLNYIKCRPELPYIPLIILSEARTIENITDCIRRGADDLLPVSVSELELIEAVKAGLIRKSRITNYLNRIRENFALAVPHELRTPLVPIIGFADLLLDEFEELSKNDMIDCLKTIKANAVRLSKRIEKFILLSAITGESADMFSRKNFKTESAEIGKEYIQKIIKESVPQEKGNLYRINIERASLVITDYYLSGIIKELADNAHRFSYPFTQINISGCIRANSYELTFENNGYGFTEAQIKSINLFTQFEKSESPKSGSGIGLFVVKKIIEMFGGRFKIESEYEKYAKIILIFRRN